MNLYECPECFGKGKCDYVYRHPSGDPQREDVRREICHVCGGEGKVTFEEWQLHEIDHPIPDELYAYDEQATAGDQRSEN